MKLAQFVLAVCAVSTSAEKWVAYINNSTRGALSSYVLQANITFNPDSSGGNVAYTFLGISGFLEDIAPAFTYHVHQYRVTNGCGPSSTGGHFDPYGAAIPPPYNPTPGNISTFEVGDLSGKHGAINATLSGQIPAVTFNDSQISFDPNHPAFIGNLSIVVHAKNSTGTRLACANIFTEAQLAEVIRQNQTHATTTASHAATTTQSGGSNPTDTPTGAARVLSQNSWLNFLAVVLLAGLTVE